jgi:hypothetical protein
MAIAKSDAEVDLGAGDYKIVSFNVLFIFFHAFIHKNSMSNFTRVYPVAVLVYLKYD